MAFLSIRRTIHLLIIAPLITVMGLTGVIVFFAGREVVNHVAEDLSYEVSEHIVKYTQNYLDRPHLVLEGMLGTAKSEITDLNHFPNLEKYMWQLVRQDELLKYIFYGDEQGRFLGVQQSYKDREQFRVKVKEHIDSDRKTHLLNQEGKRHQEVSSSDYDTHSRPWYQQAKKAQKPSWSQVYPASSSSILSISPVLPVYDRQNNLQGVLSVQISLNEISNFLQDIKDSSSLEAFIVDRKGYLIASSTKEVLSLKTDRGHQRLAAIDSSEPIIKSTAKNILQEFGNLNQITGKTFLTFNFAGTRQLVQIAPLQNREHLDWLVAVVIPETNFMSPVYRNVKFIVLCGVMITGLAIYIALKISGWIVKPIGEFDRAVQDIKQQNFDPDSLDEIAARQDEFGQLGRLFQLMATVVYQRELSLQQQLDQLHQEQQQVKESALITHYKIDRWQKLIAQAKQVREQPIVNSHQSSVSSDQLKVNSPKGYPNSPRQAG